MQGESPILLVSLGPRCDASRANDYMNAVAAEVLARLSEPDQATREIAAFAPPAAAIHGCTNRGSFNVWLTVPGMPAD